MKTQQVARQVSLTNVDIIGNMRCGDWIDPTAQNGQGSKGQARVGELSEGSPEQPFTHSEPSIFDRKQDHRLLQPLS